MEPFTPKQLDALDVLKKHYPAGVSVPDKESRLVFESIIARGTGLVSLATGVDSPTGDAYVLTDEGADAFRRDAEEQQNAQNN